MKLLLPILLFALMPPPLPALELASSTGLPAELTKLIQQFEKRRETELDPLLEKSRKSLQEAYLSDLESVTESAMSAGNLDAVTELKADRERIDAEKPLDPNQLPLSAELLELRKRFLPRIESQAEIESELIAAYKNKLDGPLNSLQISLVKQLRFDDAIAVRDFREGTGLETLLRGDDSTGKAAAFSVKPPTLAPAGRLRAFSDVSGGDNRPMDISPAEGFSSPGYPKILKQRQEHTFVC